MPKLDRAGRPIRQYESRPGKHDPLPRRPLTAAQILKAVGKLGDSRHDARTAALIALAWRGGLLLAEATRLQVGDYNHRTIRVDGDHARTIVLDGWARDRLENWMTYRRELPPGHLVCVMRGPTAGMDMQAAQARADLRRIGLSGPALRNAKMGEMLAHGDTMDAINAFLGLYGKRSRAPAGLLAQPVYREAKSRLVITPDQAREYEQLRDLARTLLPYAEPDPSGKRPTAAAVLKDVASRARDLLDYSSSG